MKAITLNMIDFGIISQGRPQCKDYRIEPDKELGRGGFRFSYSNDHPQNPEVVWTDVSGKYNHAPWPLKNYIEIRVGIVTGDLDISLIKAAKTEKDFSVNDIAESVLDLLDVMKDCIASAPGAFPKNQCSNFLYNKRIGDYHFFIRKAPWVNE